LFSNVILFVLPGVLFSVGVLLYIRRLERDVEMLDAQIIALLDLLCETQEAEFLGKEKAA